MSLIWINYILISRRGFYWEINEGGRFQMNQQNAFGQLSPRCWQKTPKIATILILVRLHAMLLTDGSNWMCWWQVTNSHDHNVSNITVDVSMESSFSLRPRISILTFWKGLWATSMFVTDVVDGLCWWQLRDVGDWFFTLKSHQHKVIDITLSATSL